MKKRTRIHLFNPENDLALAANLDRYTAPAAAAALSRCGALIPAWLANDGDCILVHSEDAITAANELRSNFGIGIEAVSAAPPDVVVCEPWGWSRYARTRFIAVGVDRKKLPSEDWLATHRALSSRLTTIDLCKQLGLDPPVAATSVDEALRAVAANHDAGHGSYLKMPWSSSGRGVFPTSGMKCEQVERRAADIIRSQGCVVVEPDRHRVADFAALYRVEDGVASFHALSAFATDSRGAYRGNLVISDDAIIDRLGVDPMPQAEKMSAALTHVVGPHYSGWAGVDMVATAYGDIYPCIELNLRATMGVVAAAMRRYFDRPMLLAPSTVDPMSHLPRPLQ